MFAAEFGQGQLGTDHVFAVLEERLVEALEHVFLEVRLAEIAHDLEVIIQLGGNLGVGDLNVMRLAGVFDDPMVDEEVHALGPEAGDEVLAQLLAA